MNYNFFRPIVNAIHSSDPCHLVTGFQFLSHTLRCLHLLNNQGQTLLCLLVQIGKISPESSRKSLDITRDFRDFCTYCRGKQITLLSCSFYLLHLSDTNREVYTVTIVRNFSYSSSLTGSSHSLEPFSPGTSIAR